MKKQKLISGSLRGNFWQPLISPEARKERSCQSFSASHIGLRADCPFHRPAFFRPGYSDDMKRTPRAEKGVRVIPESRLALVLHPDWMNKWPDTVNNQTKANTNYLEHLSKTAQRGSYLKTFLWKKGKITSFVTFTHKQCLQPLLKDFVRC